MEILMMEMCIIVGIVMYITNRIIDNFSDSINPHFNRKKN